MDPHFNTSFIPKKSLQEDVGGSTPGRYVNRRTVHGPGFFLMMLVFLIAVLTSAGIFGYTRVVEGRIKAKIVKLDSYQAAYKPETISALKRVDDRMKEAQRLISTHQAVSSLLRTVEDRTLKTVRYTRLDLLGSVGSAGGPAGMQLVLSGEAKDLKAVALQVDELSLDTEHLKEPVVTQLKRSDKGLGLFTIKAQLDPSVTLYTTTLIDASAAPGEAPELPEFIDPAATLPTGTTTAESTQFTDEPVENSTTSAPFDETR